MQPETPSQTLLIFDVSGHTSPNYLLASSPHEDVVREKRLVGPQVAGYLEGSLTRMWHNRVR